MNLGGFFKDNDYYQWRATDSFVRGCYDQASLTDRSLPFIAAILI